MNRPARVLAPTSDTATRSAVLAPPVELLDSEAATGQRDTSAATTTVVAGGQGPAHGVVSGGVPSVRPGERTGPAVAVSPQQLDDALTDEHARVVSLIRGRLPAVPPVGGEDASAVLLLLDRYSLTVAASIMRVVGRDHRERLVAAFHDAHRRRHRRSVIAVYLSTSGAERRALPTSFADGMVFDELTPVERAGMVDVLQGLTDATFAAALESQPGLREVMRVPSDQSVLEAERVVERDAAAARRTTQSEEDRRLTDRLRNILVTRAGDWKQQVLTALTRLAPSPAGPGQAPTSVPSEPRLTVIVAALERTGGIERLVDDLAAGWSVPAYRPVLLEIIRHRPVAANLAHVQRLLTRTWFDWAVRDWEAWLAYQIVRRLPPADQVAWQRLDNGRWFRRLEEELPADQRTSGAYEGIAVDEVDGEAVDVASRRARLLYTGQGAADFQRLRKAIDDEGVTAATAPGLLLRIMSAGQETNERGHLLLNETDRAELLRAVVTGLDRLGHLSRIFAALPDSWLFTLDNLHLFRRVAGLRDPAMLLRQVNDLVSRNMWRDVPVIGIFASVWSVSAHEAFVAFLLARHLPEGDRRELEATGQWAAMTAALTNDMRHAAGMHLFTDPGGAERARILDRLRDDTMWRADRAAELRTLVHMAIELGEHRWVFRRSMETRAFGIPELRPMVARFQLYAEPDRIAYQPYRIPVEPPAEDLVTLLRPVGGWLWTKLRALGSVRVGLNGLGFEDLDLNAVKDLVGLDPVQLAERRTGTNLATAFYNPRDGLFLLTMNELAIARTNVIGARYTGRTNGITVRNLTVAATFPAQNARQPAAVRLQVAGAEVEDLLITSGTQLVGIARTVLGALRMDANQTGVEEPVPSPPGQDFGLPIPVLGLLINFIVNVAQRIGYVKTSTRGVGALQGVSASVASIEFEGLAYGGEHSARAVRVGDVLIGAGLNRHAYLRQLVTVLDRRIARAQARGDAQAAAAHATRRAETVRRLDELANPRTDAGREWAELQSLRARFIHDPGNLTDTQRRRAAHLEQRFTGGAVVDVGSVTVAGLSGSLYADDIALTGLTGDVESPVFGPDTAPSDSQFLNQSDRVRAFREEGPRRPGGATEPATLPLRAETVDVRGLTYLADVTGLPTAESLRRDLERLPPGTPETRRRLLESLIDDAGEYEAARELLRRPQTPPLSADGRRLIELRLDIARLRMRARFGVNIDSLTASGAGADLLFGPGLTDIGTLRYRADSFTVRGFGMGAYHVEELSGTGVRTTPEVALGNGPDGRPRRGHRVDAETVTASGVTLDWAGNRLGRVAVTGLSGEVERLRARPDAPELGYRVTDLRAASIVVDGIDYRTESAWIHSDGPTTVTGVLLNATTHRAGAGGWSITVPRLEMARVAAENLVVERNGPGTPYRATVRSGALVGLVVTDLRYLLPASGDGQLTGARLTLGGLDQLRFGVVSGAFSFSGALGSRGGVGTLIVGAAVGRETFDLSGLVLTEGVLGTGDGQVHIERLDLNAGVTHEGDTWTVRSLDIPTLRFGTIDWRVRTGARLTSTGGVTVSGVTASGSYRVAHGRKTVHVDRLVISSVTATDLRYVEGAIDIRLGRDIPAHPGQPPLRISTITLNDFEWSSPGGVTGGRLGILSATADFRGSLTTELSTQATLDVGRLGATFSRGGNVVLSAGLSADADLTYRDSAATGFMPSEVTAHLGVHDLDTGAVHIGPDVIEFGAGTSPGLSIGTVALDRIDYRSNDLRIESMPGGRGVVVHRLTARVRVELRTERERRSAGGATASPIRRVALRELTAEAIEFDGLQLTFPNLIAPDPSGATHPVQLQLTPGETGVLRGVAVRIPVSADGLVLTPPNTTHSDWAIPELALQVLGDTDATGARRPALLLPRLRASIAGKLHEAEGRLSADRVDVTRYSGGGMLLDLTNPSLTRIIASFNAAGAPRHVLRLLGAPAGTLPEGGVSAQRVTYDTRAGVVTARELGVSQLSYEDAAGGLVVRVDRARVPGETRATLAAAGRRTTVRLPSLIIDGAYLEMTETPGRPSAATSRTPYADLLADLLRRNVNTVMDNLNGQLGFDLVIGRLAATGVPPWLVGATIPMRLGFADGHLNYQDVEAGLHTAGWAGGRLYFDIAGNQLRLRFRSPTLPPTPITPVPIPLPDFTIAHWTLSSGELTAAQAPGHLVSAWRLMQLEGWGREKLEDALAGPASAGPPSVELTHIDGRLSVLNNDPIPIFFPPAPGARLHGTIRLANHSILGLALHGNLPRTAGSTAATPGSGLEPVSLEQARVLDTQLTFPGLGDLRTGRITVEDISDVVLRLSRGAAGAGTFSNQFERFSGHIRRATAENIEWTLP